MKSAYKFMFTTLTVAALGAFVSPSVLANVAEYATLPEREFVSTKTRAEVRDETIAARRAGLIAYGERPVAPELDTFVASKTRAQVVAELRETQRLGLMPRNSEAGEPVSITPEQQRLIAQAGERAAAGQVAARR